MESRLRKSHLEKSLALTSLPISDGTKTWKPFVEMLLRTCASISSCSWKVPLALFSMFGHWIRLRSFSLIITAVIAWVTSFSSFSFSFQLSRRTDLETFATQSTEVPVRLTIIPDWYLLFASFICSKSPQRENHESVWSQKIFDQEIAW